MPPTATLEDIKAHQQRVEKDKITPDNLPPCPRCYVESEYFKIHAYRDRYFLVIVKMLIQKVFCSLVRFRCPGCGKTFTHYPGFAIPHKHYTQQTVTGFSERYVKSDDMTYLHAVMIDGSAPGHPQSDGTLSPSTVHRWITTLARFTDTCRGALSVVLQENPTSSIHRDLARLIVPKRKYKTDHRKKQLGDCRKLLILEGILKAVFQRSIFTKLATRFSFG